MTKQRCKGCGRMHGGSGMFCRSCKHEFRRLVAKARAAGYVVGSGPTHGWVFDRIGNVLAHNQPDTLRALRAALGGDR